MIAAACGDDGGGSGSGTTTDSDDGDTISLDEWIEQADDVCAANDEALDELDVPDFDPLAADLDDEQLEEVADYLDATTALQQDTIDQIEELPLPDERADDAEGILETVQQGIDDWRRAADAARDGDIDEYQEFLQSGADENEDSSEVAADLGLRECGQPHEDPTDTGSDTGTGDDNTGASDDTGVGS